MIIWRFTDGKPGHEKQSLGLVHALLRNRSGQCFDLPAPSRATAFLHWLRGSFPQASGLPKPDLLIGAGHATHFALLAARRAGGGKAIVLMQPSLPLSWFDLCIVPEHDQPTERDNVIAIRGVLNDVQPSPTRPPDQGLMLIGGTSSHFGWDDAAVSTAVIKIAQSSRNIAWQLTTSRRTPPTFLASLPSPLPGNLSLVPHQETGKGWLEQALARASQVWVTEDSVSMMYEALTAGAGVGLLQLASKRDSRVQRGVKKLVAEKWVTPFIAWTPGATLARPPQPFNEAERVAGLILTRYPHHAAL